MKKRSVVVSVGVLLVSLFVRADDTVLRILLARSQGFLHELSEKVKRIPEEKPTLFGQIQGGIKLKPTVAKPPTTSKPPEGILGSVAGKIAQQQPASDEPAWEEDPLDEIESDLLTYDNLLKKSADMQSKTIYESMDTVPNLKSKSLPNLRLRLKRQDQKNNKVKALQAKINNLIEVFYFLNNKFRTTLQKPDIDVLEKLGKEFVDLKKSGLTQLPLFMKDDLQQKLDITQTSVSDQKTIQRVNDIRDIFGLKPYRPSVPQKPETKPVSAPVQVAPSSIKGSLLAPKTLTPPPSAGGLLSEIAAGKELKKTVKPSQVTKLDFKGMDVEQRGAILNKFTESDFKLLEPDQIIALVSEPELADKLNPEALDSLESVALAMSKDSSLGQKQGILKLALARFK